MNDVANSPQNEQGEPQSDNIANALYGDSENSSDTGDKKEGKTDSVKNDSSSNENDQSKTKTGKDSSKTKNKFKFDKQKYLDQGIEDEEVLKMLEEKDKQLYTQRVSISKKGLDASDLAKKLERVTSQLEEIQKNKPTMTDEEYDELASESPSKARRVAEDIKRADEEEARLINERQAVYNEHVFNGIFADEDEQMDALRSIQKLLKADIVNLGGDDSKADEVVRQFKNSPFSSLEPGIFFNVAERARLKKELDVITNENKSLKDRLKNVPSDITKKIKSVASSPNAISSIPTSSNSNSNSKSLGDLLYG